MYCKLYACNIKKYLQINIQHKFCKMTTNACMIAVCQLTSTNNKEENLESVKRLVTQAANKNAKVIFLPEGCDYVGTTKEETIRLAETLDGPLVNAYKNLAKLHNIWLSVGGFHEVDANKKLNNCHILINNDGLIEKVYRKLHLFDVSIPEKNIYLKESDYVNNGKEIVKAVRTPAGAVALSICYDMRFPELSVLLRKQGAEILTFPSAFTNATGEAHWEILLRARAIENQCYVVAAAQYGCHNSKRISYGQSLIIDPWGRIIAECPKYNPGQTTDESFALATINKELLQKVRTDMPVIHHRRDDIYHLSTIGGVRTENKADHYYFANKIIPASIVFYITDHSYAFTNIRCVVPGHVLVAPIRVAKRLEDLKVAEVADLFQTAVKVQKIMEAVHESESSTICVQDGKYAGQTVAHVHVHILPRKEGDFTKNDEIYDVLARHDREDTPLPLRDIEEMNTEANLLKTYFD